ncbi:MAG: hypothetical protein ACTSVV_02025 [Promethearchaeota archaeon]
MRKNNFIIIVDGPDKSGKTSFINKCKLLFDIPVLIQTQRMNYKDIFLKNLTPIRVFFYNLAILDMLESLRPSIIIDRLHASEWVYAKVYKRKTFLDIDWFENELLKCGNILQIILNPSLNEISKRFKKDKALKEFNLHYAEKLKKYYNIFVNEITKLPTILL